MSGFDEIEILREALQKAAHRPLKTIEYSQALLALEIITVRYRRIQKKEEVANDR